MRWKIQFSRAKTVSLQFLRPESEDSTKNWRGWPWRGSLLPRPPACQKSFLTSGLERAKALSIFYGVQRLSGISGGMRMGKLSFPAQNGFLALLSRPASGSASVKTERVAARRFCSLVHPPVRRSLDSEGSLRDESAGALFLSPESFSPTQNRPFTAATRG